MRRIVLMLFLASVPHAATARDCGADQRSDGSYVWSCASRQHVAMRYARAARVVRARSVSLDGVVSPLREKVQEIVNACSSRVVSAVRHTRVAGTRRMSLHASGRAVDVAGNPACIYSHLVGWTRRGGGYSRDYWRVDHVHISHGGAEAGLVFSHGRTQYASRRHVRTARR